MGDKIRGAHAHGRRGVEEDVHRLRHAHAVRVLEHAERDERERGAASAINAKACVHACAGRRQTGEDKMAERAGDAARGAKNVRLDAGRVGREKRCGTHLSMR